MICNRCGAKNSDSRVRCFHCGTLLSVPENAEKPVTAKATIKTEATPKKNESNTFEVENIYTNDDEFLDDEYTDDEIIDTTEETDEEYVDNNDTYEDDDTATDDNERYNEVEYDDEYQDDEIAEYDDDADDEEVDIAELAVDETTEQHFRLAYKKKSHGFTIAIWILILVFIIIGIFVGTLLYQYATDDDGVQVTPKPDSISELNLSPPVVTKHKDANNVEYVHAVFTGTPGDRLHLKCNNTYHTFVSDKLEIDLYLEDLFDREYEFLSSVITANMNAYYVRNGKEYACNASPFQMTVPEADLILENTEQEIKVYSDKYKLEFWTATDAKVELNYKNITSYMNSMGNFKYEISVDPDSATTYSLVVKQPYRIQKSAVVIIKRDPLEIPLTIASNNAESHSEKTLTLNINTNENATITASLPILSTVPNLLRNSYEITLDLSACEYGETEILITASTAEGTSTKAFTFLYWPNEDTVTTSSNKFTTAVATNPTKYSGINYVIPSVTVTKNSGVNKFEGTCVINSVTYSVIIDSTDISKNIIIGSKYKIFAQCTGTVQNGLPVLRAWFIYNA
jgi:hypothetical protein